MIKLIKWKSNFSTCNGITLSLFNRVFIQSTNSIEFNLQGLGLYKLERELFETRKYSYNGRIQLYIPKLVIVWNNKGVKNEFKNVDIINKNNVKVVI